jgi:hypothetical protein
MIILLQDLSKREHSKALDEILWQVFGSTVDASISNDGRMLSGFANNPLHPKYTSETCYKQIVIK